MGPPLKLYSTLTRRKEELQPRERGRVGIYTCGPTVYRYAHIGNLRTYLFADLLVRVLEYNGLQVRQVKNITDVGHLTEDDFDRGEDRMLVSARLENRSPEEIAAHYTQAYLEDEARLNIRPAAVFPRATQHIEKMIEIISRLIQKGHAYEAEGTVYFHIPSFPAYGRLSGNTTDKLLSGVRGAVDPRKRHPGDFTLWKAAGEHRLQSWDSPWGVGFPGWHIECSAMSIQHLGERFDIHTGGEDNVFPHHEAEIAQSEGALGHQVVTHWMHGHHLMLSGARMAKSAGNFFRITELEDQGHDPLAFRYLALQAKYRTKLHFTPEGIAGADRTLRQLRGRVAEWSKSEPGGKEPEGKGDFPERFLAAINDDLDLPAAMALVAELGHSHIAPAARASLLIDWDRVLGLGLDRDLDERELPAAAADLLQRRESARRGKDFATSDRLRQELAEMGVQVTDTATGQKTRVVRGGGGA
ncbi:MAG: cysteine--tRNA ligase [Candidatus Dormibacteraceae bacterium]